MDPFTATITAVSFVKKLVDLAEKLHDSFQKLSRNKQLNDRLSASTLKSVRQLERFYLEHLETFNNVSELNDSMLELKTELESLYEKTQAFVSIPSNGRLSRVKPIVNAWLDRNKIEGELMELNGRIQECHMNFCTFAILRSNLITHQLLASTSRLEASTTEMHQDLSVLKNSNLMTSSHHEAEAITALHVMRKKQTTMTGIANRLVGQSSDPSDLLLQVPEDILAEMFLRNKVRSIDLSLTKLSRPKNFPIECPIDYYLGPFRSVLLFPDPAGQGQGSYRDSAIAKAVSISDILQKYHLSVSIQEGALGLTGLAVMLQKVGMFHDAVTISTWAADLFRTMVDAGPVVYQPYLCFALTSLAYSHLQADNLTDATQVVMAALELHRQQLVIFDTPEMKGQLACSLVLSARVARKNQDYDKAFEDSAEAVAIYHQIFCEVSEERFLKAVLEVGDEIITLEDDGMITSDFGVHHEVANGLEGQDKRFVDYSCALMQLAWAHHDIKRYQEASDTGRRALKMVRCFRAIFPGHFLETFAEITYFLSQATLRRVITMEEALPYATQSANLYWTLCDGSKVYIHHYYNSLCRCAAILESLGRHDEALKWAQGMAGVAKEIVKDQLLLASALEQISRNLHLLKRQDEAAMYRDESIQTYRIVYKAASEHEGAASYRLAQTLEDAGWHREAILAGRAAIMHYRNLATNGDMDHVEGLIDAYILLARCLTVVEEFDRALDEGHKGLQLLEAVIDDEPSLLPTYLWGLQVVVKAARTEDANKSMERTQDAIRQFRKLYATYPTKAVEKLPALFQGHRNALLRCNKTQEALEWLEEVEKWHQEYPLPMPFNLMAGYLSSLISHGDLLMKLGQTLKGIEVTVRMIELWKSLPPEVEHDISTLNVGSNNRTEMLIYLGKYEEALESTIGPIANAGGNPSEDLAVSLILASYATSCIGEHQAALHLAEEAVQCYQRVPIESQSNYRVYFTIWGLWRLGETRADVGEHTRSLDLAMEAYQLAVAREPSELYWGDLHHTSVLSRFLLALQLFETGDLESALRHLEELVEAQKDNIKFWPGYYPLYMNTFHTLCWCYCALGRHEEGVLRRDELGRLAKMQELLNPDIAALVRVELQAATKRPSRIALWQKIDLRCGHQRFGGPGVD